MFFPLLGMFQQSWRGLMVDSLTDKSGKCLVITVTKKVLSFSPVKCNYTLHRNSFVIEILPLFCWACLARRNQPPREAASVKTTTRTKEPRDRKNRSLVVWSVDVVVKPNKIVPNDLSLLSSNYTKEIAMASLQQAITLRVLVAGTGMTFKISLHPSELT